MATRGRPAFKPTPKMRQTVEQMKACGESENTIARALKIDVDTMRKHFAGALVDGFSGRRREVISLLFAAARKGNVTAIKKLEDMTRLAGAEASFDGAGADAPPKPPKLGKKDVAAAAATTAGEGTDWGSDLQLPGSLPN